jgi:hypothetical protein
VPLHGAHSGVNLGSLLFELLQQHQIAHRVLAITTDNASNNNTLMSSIQESVQSLGVGNAAIIRIPCIAHIIQLSLNDLLGLMKANPKNETIQTDWSDTCSGFLDSRHQNTAIANTLNKVGRVPWGNIRLLTSLRDSEISYLYQRKPSAPGNILQPPNQRPKADANPGC